MLILPQQKFCAPVSNKVAFKAKENQKQNQFSFNVNCDVSEMLGSNSLLNGTEQAEKIKAQLNDPKQKGVFVSTLTALMATVASQLTEVITGDKSKSYSPTTDKTENDIKLDNTEVVDIHKKVKTADGDTFEITISNDNTQKTSNEDVEEVVLQKHKGRKTPLENSLANEISIATEKFGLKTSEKNKLNELYNEFCGQNYKDSHLVNDETVSNKQITENLIAQLQACKSKRTLNKIIEKFQSYEIANPSLTTSDVIETEKSEKTDEIISGEGINPEIFAIIGKYKDLVAGYKNLLKENTTEPFKESRDFKRKQVDNFLMEIDNDEKLNDLKKPFLKSLNDEYSGYLYSIAHLVNNNTDANAKEHLIKMIINKEVVGKALTEWEKYKFQERSFSFPDFNSLVNSEIDQKSIEKLIELKKDGKLSSLNVKDPENYTIRLPYHRTQDNFKTLNKVHQILTGDNFKPLQSEEKELYQYKDIVNEIFSNKNSYQNLFNYLHMAGTKDLLNQDLMRNITNMYRHKDSKGTFTFHAYLRFIERVVLPEFHDEYGNFDPSYIDKKDLGAKYKEKLKELDMAVKKIGAQQIEVSSYNGHGDYSAPRFNIEFNNGDVYSITINNQGKIHTIF